MGTQPRGAVVGAAGGERAGDLETDVIEHDENLLLAQSIDGQ